MCVRDVSASACRHDLGEKHGSYVSLSKKRARLRTDVYGTIHITANCANQNQSFNSACGATTCVPEEAREL